MIKHRFKKQISPFLNRYRKDYPCGITQIIILATCYSLLATLVQAQSISSTELINNAKDYDGKTIAYAGEPIGDIMGRKEYAWINVNDGNNAIGVWINKELTKDILYTGSYKTKGDWIEVRGAFQRACPEHGGDLDIHAQAITKIKTGSIVSEKIDSHKLNLALILLGVLVLVWILKQLKHK